MRGLALPQMTTVTLVIIAVAVVIILVFIAFFINLTDSEVGNMYRFIVFVNRPYDVAEILYHTSLDNEPFFNDALRVSMVGSAINASSDINEIRFFLEKYGFDIYSISIISDEEIIEKLGNHSHTEFISNVLDPCGQDNKGYCVFDNYITGPCGVGRVEINDADKCGSSHICCIENEEEYGIHGTLDIFRCGPEGYGGELIGICTYKQINIVSDPGEPGYVTEYKECGAGRLLLDEEEYTQQCEGTNEDNTPLCCVPFDAETEAGELIMSADIPLLFKGKTLFEPRNYYCLDSSEDSCDGGYYVSGICIGPSNNKCCITDIINCKSPFEDGYCVDEDGCVGDILADDEYCPEPSRGISRFVCCDTEPTLGGENERDPSVKGICGFDEDAYNANPIDGVLDVTITTGIVSG
ncbi:hypothetical protein ACFLQN_03500 [Candidatus Aenigmatarchaeota archaeon]